MILRVGLSEIAWFWGSACVMWSCSTFSSHMGDLVSKHMYRYTCRLAFTPLQFGRIIKFQNMMFWSVLSGIWVKGGRFSTFSTFAPFAFWYLGEGGQIHKFVEISPLCFEVSGWWGGRFTKNKWCFDLCFLISGWRGGYFPIFQNLIPLLVKGGRFTKFLKSAPFAFWYPGEGGQIHLIFEICSLCFLVSGWRGADLPNFQNQIPLLVKGNIFTKFSKSAPLLSGTWVKGGRFTKLSKSAPPLLSCIWVMGGRFTKN